MYSKFSGMKGGSLKMGMKTLKSHHHVNLDLEFRADCNMWLNFLEKNDSSVCRPFVDLSKTVTAEEIFFFTDVAKHADLGFGGVYNTHWLFGRWGKEFMAKDPSIEYLELFGLCIAFYAWSRELENRRIVVFCDNESVVAMVNNTSSKC